jgi:hypothetical protein
VERSSRKSLSFSRSVRLLQVGTVGPAGLLLLVLVGKAADQSRLALGVLAAGVLAAHGNSLRWHRILELRRYSLDIFTMFHA